MDVKELVQKVLEFAEKSLDPKFLEAQTEGGEADLLFYDVMKEFIETLGLENDEEVYRIGTALITWCHFRAEVLKELIEEARRQN